MNYKTILWITAALILVLGIALNGILAHRSSEEYRLVSQKSESGWVYHIYRKNQLLIRQNTIPGIADNKAFETKEDAEKIGKIVIDRLQSKTTPSISKEDLKQHDISF
ncbi:MAG: DUF4907 domain-containing protein [Bacteroidota bacterium]